MNIKRRFSARVVLGSLFWGVALFGGCGQSKNLTRDKALAILQEHPELFHFGGEVRRRIACAYYLRPPSREQQKCSSRYRMELLFARKLFSSLGVVASESLAFVSSINGIFSRQWTWPGRLASEIADSVVVFYPPTNELITVEPWRSNISDDIPRYFLLKVGQMKFTHVTGITQEGTRATVEAEYEAAYLPVWEDIRKVLDYMANMPDVVDSLCKNPEPVRWDSMGGWNWYMYLYSIYMKKPLNTQITGKGVYSLRLYDDGWRIEPK